MRKGVDGEQRRLELLDGPVLDTARDRVLSHLADEAAATLGVRYTAVCLLLRNTIVFRAYNALPPALARARSVDRDHDPCELVVGAGCTVAIDNLVTDARAPRRLVHLGLRSYLGVPITLAGVTVGAFAAYHDAPRGYDASSRSAFESLARVCEARLASLMHQGMPRRELLERPTRTAFAELRNAMMPLEVQLGDARHALQALAAEASLLRARSHRNLDTLHGALKDIERGMNAMTHDLGVLEGFVAGGSERVGVMKIIEISDSLAHHHTKLVGGVRWQFEAADTVIEAPPDTCVGVLVHGLSQIALRASRERVSNGIAGRIAGVESGVQVELRAAIGHESVASCARSLEDLAHHTQIRVSEHDDAIQVLLPAA